MYAVRDGARTLQFNGKKLGESSSYRRGASRWIEFALYRTDSGQYVLSRVGVSYVFHSSICELVGRYGLHEIDTANLAPEFVPCEECEPTRLEPLVFPEKHRYWTLITTSPEAVRDALYMTDDFGARYLTKVAERVLEQAADNDADIDQVYRVEFIQ